MCVYTVYMYYVYINTHTCIYLRKICYDYILNIFVYKNINVYTCKYLQNIYCMCVYLYIHNKYTQHTYYVNKNLDAINRLTALFYIYMVQDYLIYLVI